jgi:hypothetical protein
VQQISNPTASANSMDNCRGKPDDTDANGCTAKPGLQQLMKMSSLYAVPLSWYEWPVVIVPGARDVHRSQLRRSRGHDRNGGNFPTAVLHVGEQASNSSMS